MCNPERLAVTMGDPSGVGAEVIVKALDALNPSERSKLVVVGDVDTLQRAARASGIPVKLVALPDAAMADAEAIIVDHVQIKGLPGRFGVQDPACGEASFRYVERAVGLVMRGEAVGLVTAPINKESLNAAGHHYDGHTGMLAALTGSKTSWMLLASERLKVIHVSTHISLSKAIQRVTANRVYQTIRIGHEHLLRLGWKAPRIAVAGINPHCGEGGLFGTEDDDAIRPGVARAQAEGISVQGPISADTLYYRAYSGAFDLVVAQYHDQGHIPIKLVAFDEAVNVSLGLPIDRTSVDHGTAFDIAGTGRANHVNMLAALSYARTLADSRARADQA